MFLETKPFLILSNEYEKKYFFFLTQEQINNRYIYNNETSFNAFILTKDNKYLVCERQNSFYWSFLIKNLNYYNTYLYTNLSSIVKNLLLEEFLAFILFLIKNNVIEKKFILNKKYNLKNIQKNILLLEKSKINLKYIKNNCQEDLDNILNDFLEKKIIIKKHHNLIVPGGKQNKKDKNYLSVILREVEEEINVKLNKTEINILNEEFVFVNSLNDFKPIYLYIKIFDKILKKYFNNICILIKTDINFCNIDFNSNKEIKNIFYIKSNINKYFDKNNFIFILKRFNSFFNNG